MADAFIGKWQVDLASTAGLEEFGAAIGFNEERIQTYKNLSYVIEFSTAGDTFTATVTFAVESIPAQSYSFKLGETFDYNAIDGTKPKLTITVEGGKIVEKYNLEDKDKQWETVREVAGTVMTTTTTYSGKSVTQKLNKQ